MKYSFNDNRKCQNCNAPISDQTHALRKSCPRQKMPDGSVISCKDDFHCKKNKKDNKSYRKFVAYHKFMEKRIELLLKHKGDTVYLEDLNRYGIDLKKPVEFSENEKKFYTYKFMHHSLIQFESNNFKIINHGSLY